MQNYLLAFFFFSSSFSLLFLRLHLYVIRENADKLRLRANLLLKYNNRFALSRLMFDILFREIIQKSYKERLALILPCSSVGVRMIAR